MRLLPLACAALLWGCGDQARIDPGPAPEPGGCAAGELTLADGGCAPAGMLEDECAAGFEPDGAHGCRARIAECPPGEVAWLGESECHPLTPCPAGLWPDEADAGAQHADASYVDADSDGSRERPWRSLQEAFDAAAPGQTVLVAAGSYVGEAVLRTEGVRVVGACPALTRIEGTLVDRPALFVNGAHNATVTGVSVGGAGFGVAIQDATGVIVVDVTVNGAARAGIVMSPYLTKDIEVSLQRVLVEDVSGYGVGLHDGSANLDDVVVRRVSQHADGTGYGLQAVGQAGAPARLEGRRVITIDTAVAGALANDAEMALDETLVLRAGGGAAEGRGIFGQRASLAVSASVVEQYHGVMGIGLEDGSLVLDRVTVRGGAPLESSPAFGVFAVGITTASPSIEASRTTIRDVYTGGLVLGNARAVLERVRIADVDPDPLGQATVGLAAITWLGSDMLAEAISELTGNAVVIERAADIGLGLYGAKGSLDSLRIEGASSGARGRCAGIELSVEGTESSEVILDGADIGPCLEGGVLMYSSLLEARDLVIHDVAAIDQGWGLGLVVDRDPSSAVASTARLAASRIERAQEAGILVAGGSILALEASHVAAIGAGIDGLFGDGVVAMQAAEVSVAKSVVRDVARAGLSSFEASIAIGGSELACNPIHLNQEGDEPGFTDADGNRCHCEGSEEVCQVLSSSLSPPAAPGPAGPPGT